MMNELITADIQTVVEGKYKLGPVARRSSKGTVYETDFVESGGSVRPAVIKIREIDRDCSESSATRWRSVMELAHPHLLRLYAAGTSVVDGNAVEYVVMERADESLGGVLAERTLTDDEVREMLGPTVEALRYLHKKGYAHGALKASNVMAVGDRLKLSSDSATRMVDGGAPENDMQALGGLILEALGPKDPAGLLLDIARHCRDADVTRRWTVDQLAAELARPAVEPVVEDENAEVRAEVSEPREMPKWIVAGLAALVSIVLLAAVLRSKDSGPAPAPPAPVVLRERPAANPTVPVVAQPAPAVSPRAGKRGNGWSVIVAAYSSHDAAEKRMRKLAGRWKNFHLSVLEQHAEKAPYMVVLGENLSEEEAESLRQRALSSGLPRDTYIKKLM